MIKFLLSNILYAIPISFVVFGASVIADMGNEKLAVALLSVCFVVGVYASAITHKYLGIEVMKYNGETFSRGA